MPHCIVEYSQNVEPALGADVLIDSVYRGALNTELFQARDIKTRCISFSHYQTGFEKEDFIHVEVKILTGRTLDQRRQLSQSILSELKKLELKKLELSSLSLTVEINEIEAESYSKVVL